MKTDTLKKSLLDYAIKGRLSAKFRRENSGLNAFDEINTYNEAIKEKRKKLEKEFKKCEKEFKLEKDKDKKAFLKSQIQSLKKEIVKCKEITPLNLSESPFTIPNSWAWVKLGDICEMKKGPFGSAITKDMFIPNGSNAVKIYEQKNAIQKSETLGEYYISLEHFEKLKQFEVFENDIIVSCAGTIGEIFRIPKNAPKGIINQALMKIKLVNEEWIPYFMIFFDFLIKQKSQENSKGSAIKNIPPLDILKNFTIPLPPLCEQQEIVKKLDLLVTLANDFAITKENLKRIEKRIEKSLLKLALEGSLSKLYRRSSPTLSAFDEISTYNDNIKEKRKDLEKKLKICEKELKLEKEKDKKAFLKSQIQILKKEIAKCKEITPLNLSEAPFEIPSTWAWVKGCDIFLPIDNTEPQGDFFKYIDIDSIDNKNKKVKSPKTIETKNASSRARRPLEYGDVLFSMVRPYLENIALIDETLADCIASTGFFVCRTNILDSRFLYYLMTSPYVVYGLNSFMKGDNSPSIVKDDILNFNYPLPPLCEQEYIVQTLNTLFTLKKGLRVD
ncbi:restriction endonuclease subunit S [Campylobacter upsaliensis]|nr:restriction endonuclease subunit S [Campylobacter upsaliensis]